METQNDTEPQTGMTIYLLCEDCEDSWGNFTVLGWSHDKDLLTAECTRLENEKYQKERKIWDESGGEPNFGPIAPDDRQNGYRQYYVKEVGQWPTPNNDLVNKNEKLIMSEGSREGREDCPVLNAHCKFYSYQCDSNGDVAISHCCHPDNINDREGNCTHTLCPL